MDRGERTLAGIAIGSLASVFTAAWLVGVRGDIANANIALILVVCVLLGAITGGRLAGALSALAAAASFDFFHTRPYNSLKIANGQDIVTTMLLLVVGLAVGEVALLWRRVRVARDDERDQLRRLERISGLMSHDEHVDDLVLAVCAELIETLGLRDCHFEQPPYLGRFPRLQRTGVTATRVHWYTHEGFELPREGAELLAEANGEALGRFVLLPTPGVGVSTGRRLIAVALADQLATVLARRVA